MGWVNLAMAKILGLTLGITKLSAVMICLALTLVYTTISGLWGVLWTDLLQFVLKMSMVIALAYFAVQAVGGMGALKAQEALHDARTGGHTLALPADLGSSWFPHFSSSPTVTCVARWG